MLVGVIGEYVATGKQTFDLATLATLAPSPSIQFALFFVFALAFAIKTPLFPFHSWLPDAYAAAPTPMLVTFAGVMCKAGAYGFLRIAIPLFPEPVGWWDWRRGRRCPSGGGSRRGGPLGIPPTRTQSSSAR